MREATELFRALTGFSAVASFASAASDFRRSPAILPPLHPLCASRLYAARVEPCAREWQRHVRRSLRSRTAQGHVCPVGLRCGCVPIYYGDALVGIAKCVTQPGTNSRRFSRALQVLELAVAKTCQDFRVTVQGRELDVMRDRVTGLREILCRGGSARIDAPPVASEPAASGGGGGHTLVERALDCIALHYLEHDTTLKSISLELGVTENYLTRRFTEVVGQRMHAYLLQLRIQHACREVLVPGKSLKQIAYESGFNGLDAFRRSFHRFVGVAPGTYRAAFARD